MTLIRFVLSGPLQSWGDDARWDHRTTASMPTKSAVVGLLGSALGYSRGDPRLNELNDRLYVAVRADRSGTVMTDFHTVQGNDGVILNAEGKPRGGGNVIITPKSYLQDAWFTVFVWGNMEKLDLCFQGMLHPKWSAYLGRKSCVPAIPIKPEWVEAESAYAAVDTVTKEEKKHCQNTTVQVEMDIEPEVELHPNARRMMRHDNIIRADRNEYSARWIQAYSISVGGEEDCI